MPEIKKEGVGLVFTAGFDAGPFQAGAAIAIKEWLGDVKPKVVVGSSMGAVTGAAIAADVLGEYIGYWRKIKPSDLLTVHWYNFFRLPFSPRLASLDPLRKRLRQLKVGERLLKSSVRYAAVSFNLNYGKQRTFTNASPFFDFSPL